MKISGKTLFKTRSYIMSAERFKLIMRGLFVIYSKQNDAEIVKIYWGLMKDYDIQAIEAAFKKYVISDEKCEFFPKPGQIIKLITGSEKADETHEAHEKWAEIIESVKSGRYEIADDSVYEAVRQIGGLRAIGMINEDRLDWKKREFIERYLDILDRNKRKLMLGAPISEITSLNRIEGHIST